MPPNETNKYVFIWSAGRTPNLLNFGILFLEHEAWGVLFVIAHGDQVLMGILSIFGEIVNRREIAFE